jgi:hypothetical protein
MATVLGAVGAVWAIVTCINMDKLHAPGRVIIQAGLEPVFFTGLGVAVLIALAWHFPKD